MDDRTARGGGIVSETSVETSRTSSGGNFLTKKIGPLPTWGWMAISLVLVVLYAYYKKSKGSTSSTAAANTAAAANAPGGVDASLVPQFINQTYVQETPPAAPDITNNSTVNSNDVNSNNTAPTVVNSPTTVNKPPPVTPPPKTPTPSKNAKTTTVTVAKWTATNTPWNSTLSGIANHYKVPGGYPALAKLNHISNPNLIYPGQKIVVPLNA